MNTQSVHILVEFWNCRADLNNAEALEDYMWRAVFEANARPLHVFAKKFEPSGVSVFVVIAESHLSIHTWPEESYAAVDVFTCGEHTNPRAAVFYLQDVLMPGKHSTITLGRGRSDGVQITSFSKAAEHCKLR